MKSVAIGKTTFSQKMNVRAALPAPSFSLVEGCQTNKVNPLTHIIYLQANVRNTDMNMLLLEEFVLDNVALTGDRCSKK